MHGQDQEKQSAVKISRRAQRTNAVAFRKFEQLVNREQCDQAGKGRQHCDRGAQNDRKNNWDKNDGREDSFDELQISPAGRARLAPELIALEWEIRSGRRNGGRVFGNRRCLRASARREILAKESE